MNPDTLMPEKLHIVAISNRKGGTGKTTVSVNLAMKLGTLGRPVLLVDRNRRGRRVVGLDRCPKTQSRYNAFHGSNSDIVPTTQNK